MKNKDKNLSMKLTAFVCFVLILFLLALMQSMESVIQQPLLIEEHNLTFTVDQIIEAKSIGADAILLIAAILSEQELVDYAKLANSLGLEVLHEVHNADELSKINLDSPKIIGVNNRDLTSFKTDIQTSIDLAKRIPSHHVKVSESGINQAVTIKELRQHGFSGFLIGENFMKTANPGAACKNFIKQL